MNINILKGNAHKQTKMTLCLCLILYVSWVWRKVWKITLDCLFWRVKLEEILVTDYQHFLFIFVWFATQINTIFKGILTD